MYGPPNGACEPHDERDGSGHDEADWREQNSHAIANRRPDRSPSSSAATNLAYQTDEPGDDEGREREPEADKEVSVVRDEDHRIERELQGHDTESGAASCTWPAEDRKDESECCADERGQREWPGAAFQTATELHVLRIVSGNGEGDELRSGEVNLRAVTRGDNSERKHEGKGSGRESGC